jgi:DNA-binding IclR family transcriptional regulator
MENTTKRRGRPAGSNPPEQRVEAVERALSILEAFAHGGARLSLAEIACRTGFYPSTILRLAASLERFGHLRRGADGMFRLGPACLRLGQLYRAGFDLAEHIRPALARLVAASGETAAFYVREGEVRICLFRQHPERLIRHHIEEGASLPLDRGASGHVLRGFTGEADPRAVTARAKGIAISIGERDAETAAIAVPILGADGRFLGALGITGPIGRFADDRLAAFSPLLRAEADGLARCLRG